MNNELINIKEYCIHYRTEPSFVEDLEDLGLIRILHEEDGQYIENEQLTDLERYSRMFYDLEINLAGIDAIRHLLEKIEEMRREIREMHNRLKFYE